MGRDNKKGGRGGGGGRGAGKKMFIANIEEMEMRDREQEELREERARRRADDEDAPAGKGADDDDDESEEEEVKPKKKETVFGFQRGAEGEEAAGGLAGRAVNPNRQPKATEGTDPEAGMNRKEREALAAQKAKEDYMRRHLAGETEQARADLARLAIVRQRREEAAAKRKAEGRPPGWSATGVESSSESDSDSNDDGPQKGKGKGKTPAGAKGAAPAATAAPVPAKVTGAAAAAAAHAAAQAESAAAIAAKKKAAALGEGEPKTAGAASASGPPKLSSMEIKKLNGDGLKEHLKARGLDVQGQKKDLMKRLQDYENAR